MNTIEINGMVREVQWHHQVQPDLAVLVDDSWCIVLECGLGEHKRYVTLSDCSELNEATGSARAYVKWAEDDQYAGRLAEVDEYLKARKDADRS